MNYRGTGIVIVATILALGSSIAVLADWPGTCFTHELGGCLNLGDYCEDAFGAGHCLDSTPLVGPCVCDHSPPPPAGDDGCSWCWDISSDDDPQEIQGVLIGPDPDSEDPVLPGIVPSDGEPTSASPYSSITEALYDGGAEALIGHTICVAQTNPVSLRHDYGESWGYLAPDHVVVDGARLCLRFKRMAEPDEMCDHERWLYFDVVDIDAKHPGFRPSAFPWLSTGRIDGHLDDHIKSFGFVYLPRRPEQRPWVQMRVNARVSAENLAGLLPGFDSFPVSVDAKAYLDDSNGRDRLVLHDYKVNSMTPPTFHGPVSTH